MCGQPMYEATFHFPDDDCVVSLPAHGIPRKGDTITWQASSLYQGDEYEITGVHWTIHHQSGTQPTINITLDPIGRMPS